MIISRVIRTLRLLVLKTSRKFMCYARIIRAKVVLEGISIAWSATLGRGVFFLVTDIKRIVVGARACISSGSHHIAQGGSWPSVRTFLVGTECVITCKAGIDIGDDALIAEYVTIRDQDHTFPAGVRIREAGFDYSTIVIGDDVWLAAKSSVLKGSRIGSGRVVGDARCRQGAVSENSVVTGIPSGLVRERAHDR